MYAGIEVEQPQIAQGLATEEDQGERQGQMGRQKGLRIENLVHTGNTASLNVAFNGFNVSRRDAVSAGGAVLLAGLLNVSPAQAFLGFGEGAQRAEAYKSDTSAILGKVNLVLSLDKDDPAKEDRVKELRKDINTWVAKYRRDDTFAGRPSFGNTYSALNAIAGHYNSFGATAPIPKKRLDRLTKELGDAELLLTRDR
eukprot:gene7015-7229_t